VRLEARKRPVYGTLLTSKPNGDSLRCGQPESCKLPIYLIKDDFAYMSLAEILEKYLAVAGGYGKAVAFGSLGLSRREIEQTFSAFDEDYNISRYLHFSNGAGECYSISDFPQTHVWIDVEIQTIL